MRAYRSIIHDLQVQANKHRGKTVGAGEVRIDFMADECAEAMKSLLEDNERCRERIQHLELLLKEKSPCPPGNIVHVETLSRSRYVIFSYNGIKVSLYYCMVFPFGTTEDNQRYADALYKDSFSRITSRIQCLSGSEASAAEYLDYLNTALYEEMKWQKNTHNVLVLYTKEEIK